MEEHNPLKISKSRIRELDKKDALLKKAQEIEEATAIESNNIAYMAKNLIIATLPHSDPKSNEYVRHNGKYTLTMLAPSKIGLPFGAIPRLFLIWLSSVINKIKSREIPLSESFNAFSKELGYHTGGKDGKRIKTQLIKLFSTTIMFHERTTSNGITNLKGSNKTIAEDYNFWWESKNPDQLTLFDSYVTLSEYFYDELMKIRVPLDMRVIMAFRDEPMAIDIYAWLTYRFSTMQRDTFIETKDLVDQFGSDYKDLKHFNTNFKKTLDNVLIIYKEARVDVIPGRGAHTKSGILLHPSQPHVPKMLITPK